eukprot:364452-Chlamydomonas_euryale.AAC.5
MKPACCGRFLTAHSQGMLRKMAAWHDRTSHEVTGALKIYVSGIFSSAIWGCHEEGGTSAWGFLKLPGHTKLIPWPEV